MTDENIEKAVDDTVKKILGKSDKPIAECFKCGKELFHESEIEVLYDEDYCEPCYRDKLEDMPEPELENDDHDARDDR